MKIKLIFLIFVMFMPLSGSAMPDLQHHDKESKIVKNYMDSLSLLKMRDSGSIQIPAGCTYERLFVPMTFYNNIIHNQFQINTLSKDSLSDENQIDMALLNIYMKKPDLVIYSEKKLDLNDKNLTKEPTAINASPDLVGSVAPKAEEPDYIPSDIIVMKPNFWTLTGDYYLQFLQNYVSGNWYKGGVSSYSTVGSVTMQYNYNNKQKIKWDNKLELRLGYQTSRGDTVHNVKTSEDVIRYTTKAGLQATKKWYYTLQMIATTQFTHGYKNNDVRVYSDFLSPLTVNISLGMDYSVSWLKNRLTGSVHLAPLAYNFKYVGREDLETTFGLDDGSHTLNDFGSELSADLTWQIIDQIKWKSRIYAYTTYKRSEIELENTITFQLNKYLATNIFVYPRFDDARTKDYHHGYWEFKEYCSVGFSYSF